VEFTDPTVLTPIGVFPVGVTEVTLTVTFSDPTTGEETSATDTVLVAITDTAAPMLLVSADPAQLWPPNHKLHDIHVDVLAFDACQADPAVELVDIFSSEPDDGIGDGNTDGDIQDADLGTDDRDFALRAERSGPGDGRVYTAVYGVTNLAGNHVEANALVVVPHDMGDGAANGHDPDWKLAKKEMVKAQKISKKLAEGAEGRQEGREARQEGVQEGAEGREEGAVQLGDTPARQARTTTAMYQSRPPPAAMRRTSPRPGRHRSAPSVARRVPS
jgi:hypothetical protein